MEEDRVVDSLFSRYLVIQIIYSCFSNAAAKLVCLPDFLYFDHYLLLHTAGIFTILA